MAKETERANGTHSLESADRETSQNGKRKRVSDRYSLPGERRQKNKSEWQMKKNKRRALTLWGTEEQVRMANETERATGTHSLENADGGTSQNGKRNRASNGHSRPGERRQRGKLEWEKKQGERRARRQRGKLEWEKKQGERRALTAW
jgi:hypothetical protein